jgi:molybdopterin-guanine dinucleotide biosynthesis protein A
MSIDRQNITAVILAGGKGSRLGGQDKGLVIYNGKPLIEHVLERIKPQVATIIINANRNHATYRAYGYKIINDSMQNFQGPLAGFSAVMQVVATDYIITMPCDGPLIANDLVSRLSTSLQNDPDNIAVAHNGKRLQPVYALIPTKLQHKLNHFLNQGKRGVNHWYNQQGYIPTDFSDNPDAFKNINTEQERLNLEQYI